MNDREVARSTIPKGHDFFFREGPHSDILEAVMHNLESEKSPLFKGERLTLFNKLVMPLTQRP